MDGVYARAWVLKPRANEPLGIGVYVGYKKLEWGGGDK